MKKRAFCLLGFGWATFAFLGGCHSSSSAEADTSQVDSFIQSSSQAACDWELNCCTDAEIKTIEQNKYTTKEQCLPYKQLAQENSLYLDRLAVREGRMRVDPTHAAACIQRLSSRACNPKPGAPQTPPPTTTVDDCAKVFTGNTALGAECIYAKECVEGGHCVNDAQAVGRGVCVPYQKVGEICNSDTDCDPSTQQIYCAKQDFKCHVRAKIGEPCAYTMDAAGTTPTLPMLLDCDRSADSAAYCDPVSNTCMSLPTAGQPCLATLPPGVAARCNPDPSLQLVCDSLTGTGAGTCRAPGQVGDDCSKLPCAADLYCNRASATSSVCAALPGLGQPCVTSGGRCAKPYYCNFNQGAQTCQQPAALGEDCSLVTCDTGLYCDTSAPKRVCKTALPDGASCTTSSQCLSLLCGGAPQACQPRLTGLTCTGR